MVPSRSKFLNPSVTPLHDFLMWWRPEKGGISLSAFCPMFFPVPMGIWSRHTLPGSRQVNQAYEIAHLDSVLLPHVLELDSRPAPTTMKKT